ncbi:hypothetical protein ACQKGC_10625 [Allorhizobium pseudoryzae]|uniref:hypothetical protein n=1 Tax=Allorhizobium pseudoryzae TaxID=379684 RepID=UPI003D086EB2
MSIETLLAFGATSLLVLLLPSASGMLLRDYSLVQGRARSAFLIPALWLGYLVAGGLAGTLYVAIHTLAPAMQRPLGWLGVVILGLYLLRSQQRRFAQRLADNDNLPARRWDKAFFSILVASLGPGLAVVVASLFFQMSDTLRISDESFAQAFLAYALAALVAPFVQLLIAESSARKISRARRLNPASRKPRTRFIASRAVSAGYRRIAA